MRFNKAFLYSRVARRIFILFILCAFIPITALSITSFVQVTRQLNNQSKKRLHQASKAIGMAIFERLIFLQSELKTVSSNLNLNSGADKKISQYNPDEHFKRLFSGLSLVNATGRYVNIFGNIDYHPQLTIGEKKHIASGKTLLLSNRDPKGKIRLFMLRAFDTNHPDEAMILGEINPSYLWGIVGGNKGDGEDLSITPASTEVCILTDTNDTLFCSYKHISTFPRETMAQNRRSSSGQFEWGYGGKDYIAAYWSIFLKPSFFYPMWVVVLSESKEDVLAPIYNFQKIFLLIILLTIWVIGFLSTNQIRRSLLPLEKLMEGTKRIAMRDFKSKVSISSGDEFEELADSFNTMAHQLERQFKAISTMNEIDRTILSKLDTNFIIDTVLKRASDIFHSRVVGITILDIKKTKVAKTYIKDIVSGDRKDLDNINIPTGDIQSFCENREIIQIDLNNDIPDYLAPIVAITPGIRSFLILPIFLKERLSGIISLGYIDNTKRQNKDDIIYARQLADQVAVALSNAEMVEELKDINWGILKALSRTIDAKSKWTAGHSERVTELALEIGKALHLTEKELNCLHRAALLHDIGKIGINDLLLNKGDTFSDRDIEIIKEHPVKGADILEPITQFSEVIKIIRYHHERFDGKGYPEGLKGNDIPLIARILTVADAYDAMVSDRPYREALTRESAIAEIKKASGKQFDPEIVGVFVEIMEERLRLTGSELKR